MRLTRRALVALAGAVGISGRSGATGSETESEDAGEADVAGSGLYGEGVYGAGVYGGTTDGGDDPEEDLRCFIATAAAGSPHHDDVETLRAFRDATLRSSVPGRLFIETYYRLSPPVARWIARSDRRRRVVTAVLVRPAATIASTARLTETTDNGDTTS